MLSKLMSTEPSRSLRKNTLVQSTAKGLLVLGIYLAWTSVFRLIALSVVTYALLPGQPKFLELHDRILALSLPIAALSTTGFIGVLALWSRTRFLEFSLPTRSEWKNPFLPTFVRGFALGCATVAGLTLAGAYRIQTGIGAVEESAGAIATLSLRCLAFISLILGEEIVFRRLTLRAWERQFPESHPLLVAGVVSAVYLGCKSLQFELATMAEITLVLLSTALTLTSIRVRSPWRGAGALTGYFLATSAIFGLPFLGAEGSGLFLLQYTGGGSRTAALLTGGLGGILSSAVLQLGLTLWIILEVRKTTFTSPRSQVD